MGYTYTIPETFVFNVKPTKRYRMVFSIWGHINSDSVSDFDTIEELEEEKKLVKEVYNATPRPEKVYKEKSYRYEKRKYEVSYENDGCYWGYITLDYQEKKILEIYNDGCRVYKIVENKTYPHYSVGGGVKVSVTKCPYTIDRKTDKRRVMDIFFRTEEDVPVEYAWVPGEYEGWLQFKWGDGKNAIGYVEPEKKTKSQTDEDDDFNEDDIFDEYMDRNEEIATTLEDQLHEETMKRLRNKWYDY